MPWPTAAHQPHDAHAEHQAADVDEEPREHVELPEVGQIVHRSYFDHYNGPGGQEATQTGIVVAVDADTGLVTVAPLPDPFVAPADELT